MDDPRAALSRGALFRPSMKKFGPKPSSNLRSHMMKSLGRCILAVVFGAAVVAVAGCCRQGGETCDTGTKAESTATSG
jgi:hypothetical protein